MRIQNNITAMNTHRMYTINNNSVSRSAEKLSSGYRINRAGDDAAGLAISEKMRAQIRGLNMASKNSQDAVSLIQTAEGALQEVHSMLQRMNELANQASTGTNQTFDRDQINAEFNQLKNEIDQIADTTTFNQMKLLDGSLASDAASVSVDEASSLMNGKTLTATNAAVPADNTGYTVTKHSGLSSQVGDYAIADNGDGSIRITFTDAETQNTTNTDIKLADVITGEIGNGKSFSVDLSEAGLGVYTMTANNTGTADIASLASALATGTVATTTGVTDPVTPPVTGASVTLGAPVNGVATIPAGAPTPAQEHIFSIDLAGLVADNSGSDTFTLTVGGVELTASGALGDGADGATIAASVAGTNATVEIDGVEYAISNDSGAVLTFTATSGGPGAASATGTYSVANSGSGSDEVTTPTSAAITEVQAGAAEIPGGAEVPGTQASASMTFNAANVRTGDVLTIDGNDFVFQLDGETADPALGTVINLDAAALADNDALATAVNAAVGAVAGFTASVSNDGSGTLTYTQDVAAAEDMTGFAAFTQGPAPTPVTPDEPAATAPKGGLKIQVGANEGEQLTISVASMNTRGLRIRNSVINDQEKAGNAITATQEAINLVSEQRATLGAMQNRLEHKIANLDNTSENLSAAESRIRDVDIAKEMTSFTKSNILSQASTAMLAQANAAPQGVLSLLQ